MNRRIKKKVKKRDGYKKYSEYWRHFYLGIINEYVEHNYPTSAPNTVNLIYYPISSRKGNCKRDVRFRLILHASMYPPSIRPQPTIEETILTIDLLPIIKAKRRWLT